MISVITLKGHSNAYGKPFNKRKGSMYSHPNPTALIQAGLVKLNDKNDSKGRGSKSDRGRAVSAKKLDGEGSGEASRKEGAGADKE